MESNRKPCRKLEAETEAMSERRLGEVKPLPGKHYIFCAICGTDAFVENRVFWDVHIAFRNHAGEQHDNVIAEDGRPWGWTDDVVGVIWGNGPKPTGIPDFGAL